MAYTDEQIATLRNLATKKDELSAEQYASVIKHLQAIDQQLAANPKPSSFGEAAGSVVRQMAPTAISALAPIPFGAGTRLLLRNAPGALRAPLATTMESLGSGGTEYGLQKTGLVEESPGQIGTAMTVPYGVQTLSGLTKFGARHLPGMEHIEQDVLAGQLKHAPERFIPRGPLPAKALYENLDTTYGTMPIPQTKTLETANHLLNEQNLLPEKILRKPAISKMSEQTIAAVNERGGNLSLKEARERLKALRKEVRNTSDDTAVHDAHMLRARAALEDIEGAATTMANKDAARDLTAANLAYRRELAQDDLAYRIEKYGVKTGDMRGMKVIKPRAILDWIDSPDSTFFRESLKPEELKSLRKYLGDLPELKADFGSSRLGSWERAAMGLGMAAGAVATGEPMGMAAGAGVAYGVSQLVNALSWAVTSPTGRKLLRDALSPSGQGTLKELTPSLLTSLGAAMASELRGNKLKESDSQPAPGTNLVPFQNMP